ncbi:MAG: S1 RNA-binding domain-containing protein [Oceanospirillaceae bacterium]|nr:S1 RNA-binding domain-containing protein [Oceanospirillaceae bacterium]
MKNNIGRVVNVQIKKVTDDGLEVTFNNFEGVVRIIDLAWDTKGLLEVIYTRYKPFDVIKVKIMAADETKFLASVRDMFPEENPWNDPTKYILGNKFNAGITDIKSFGYILKLDTGATALLKKNNDHKSDYKLEQNLMVVVCEVDPSIHKIIVELDEK